jgi:Mg/Co/Ni transporter MgtE
MAVGDVEDRDVPRVVAREVGAGAVLGLALAAVAIVPAALFAELGIAVVVCLSLVVICVLATFVGSVTPIVARRIGADPAVVSAPLISTLVDASGLIIYFLVARVLARPFLVPARVRLVWDHGIGHAGSVRTKEVRHATRTRRGPCSERSRSDSG